MSLKQSIAVILGTLVVGFTAVGYFTQRHVVLHEFLQIEQKKAKADADRCREAVLREVEHVATTAADWAYWDDTHAFVLDENDEYKSSNLTLASQMSLSMNGMWLVDTTGRIVATRAADLESGAEITFASVPKDRFPLDHPWLKIEGDTGVTRGLISTEHGPLMFASRRILTSQRTGPSHGTLIFARLVTPKVIEQLREQTRVDFSLFDVNDPALSDEAKAVVAEGHASAENVVRERDSDTLNVYRALEDSVGHPAFLVRAEVARDISREGERATNYATASLFGAGTVTVLMLSFILGLIVVTPLRRLTTHAAYVGSTGDLTHGSGISRRDEIGSLATAFDDMVNKLQESRTKLSESARLAGMADVARAVLHNVGNVLNNATVATSSIAQTVRQSRLAGFSRAIGLIEQHRSDLGNFLSQDPRGKQLPDYLAQLAKVLKDEHTAVIEDVTRLTTSLDHAAQIIQQQRVLATASDVKEVVTLTSLVDNARGVVDSGFLRHGIDATWRVSDDRPCVLDRTKVLQILVNLLTNAKEALGASEPGERRVVLDGSVVDGRIRITVTDSGQGIAADSLARIFQSGYTTKADGSGVGLHYSANAATECGGSLTAQSDGPGKGATFVLDLPFRPPTEGKETV